MTAGPTPVTVVTVNVKAFQLSSGEGADERAFDAIERYIEAVDADVVLLQEVDRGTARSGRADQLAQLARRVDADDTQFGKALDHQGGEYGVGVLTRNGHRIEGGADGGNRAQVVPLPRSTGWRTDHEQRVALVAPIATPTGERFTAVSTHLANRGRGRGDQLERLRDVVDDVRAGHADRSAGLADDLPTAIVLGGDFNTRRWSADRRLDGAVDHVRERVPQLRSTRIDHVYVSDEFEVVEAALDEPEVLREHWLPFGLGNLRATDHPAVRATLLLR